MTINASIDMGTNSTRLLLAEIDSQQNIRPLLMQEYMTKLGDGLDDDGNLSSEAIEHVIQILALYTKICKQYHARKIVLVATSATREAKNKDIFLKQIELNTGLKCRILSGDEEAILSFKGTLSDIQPKEKYLVCDIGGGSTEFIYAKRTTIIKRKSLPLGSRRLKTLFFRNDPPDPESTDRFINYVNEHLLTLNFKDLQQGIFLGGTATSVALLHQKADIKENKKCHHYSMTQQDLQNMTDKLSQLSVEKRKTLKGLNPERADVILSGLFLMKNITRYFNLSHISTSLRDLLFGVLIE